MAFYQLAARFAQRFSRPGFRDAAIAVAVLALFAMIAWR